MPALTTLLPELVKLAPLVGSVASGFAKLLDFLTGFGLGDSRKDPAAGGDRIDDFVKSEGHDFFSMKTLENVGNTAKVIGKGALHGITFNAFRDDPPPKPASPMKPPMPPAKPAPPVTQGAHGAPGQTSMDGTTKKFDATIDKFSGAIDKLNKSGPPDASRTAPIVSPSRG